MTAEKYSSIQPMFYTFIGTDLSRRCRGHSTRRSLGASNRSKYSWRKANPLGSLKFLRKNVDLLRLATVHFLLWLSRAMDGRKFGEAFPLSSHRRGNRGPNRRAGLQLQRAWSSKSRSKTSQGAKNAEFKWPTFTLELGIASMNSLVSEEKRAR
jgi:hypothetical protein